MSFLIAVFPCGWEAESASAAAKMKLEEKGGIYDCKKKKVTELLFLCKCHVTGKYVNV